jgi:hypothetical protein
MASTRNKNAPGDYSLEQQSYNKIGTYIIEPLYGEPAQQSFAGDGILMGRMPSRHLSNNYCDVESQLFGIGSTNLVTPKSLTTPEFKSVKSLNIIDKIPVILPDPLIVDKDRRPQWT